MFKETKLSFDAWYWMKCQVKKETGFYTSIFELCSDWKANKNREIGEVNITIELEQSYLLSKKNLISQ